MSDTGTHAHIHITRITDSNVVQTLGYLDFGTISHISYYIPLVYGVFYTDLSITTITPSYYIYGVFYTDLSVTTISYQVRASLLEKAQPSLRRRPLATFTLFK